MNMEIANYVLGVLTGVLISVGITVPRVGRILAQLFAIAALICGVALLSAGIVAMATGSNFSALHWQQFRIAEPVQAIGLGGGLLVGGVLAIVLSMLSKSRQPQSP